MLSKAGCSGKTLLRWHSRKRSEQTREKTMLPLEGQLSDGENNKCKDSQAGRSEACHTRGSPRFPLDQNQKCKWVTVTWWVDVVKHMQQLGMGLSLG